MDVDAATGNLTPCDWTRRRRALPRHPRAVLGSVVLAGLLAGAVVPVVTTHAQASPSVTSSVGGVRLVIDGVRL